MHTGTCAAIDKACVAQCRHVGPFRDLMFGSRYLVPVFLHFFVRTARGRRSGFLAFASGIVRVVISVIVAKLAAYGVANLHY